MRNAKLPDQKRHLRRVHCPDNRVVAQIRNCSQIRMIGQCGTRYENELLVIAVEDCLIAEAYDGWIPGRNFRTLAVVDGAVQIVTCREVGQRAATMADTGVERRQR